MVYKVTDLIDVTLGYMDKQLINRTISYEGTNILNLEGLFIITFIKSKLLFCY